MWRVSASELSFPHRVGHATMRCVDRDGRPLAGQSVVVEQVKHDFLFGNIGFDFMDYAIGRDQSEWIGQLLEQYLNLYNATTLPFYLGRYEPVPGQPDAERMMATARLFHDHGHQVKGHPLVWHTITAGWMNQLPLDQVEAALRQRIRRDVSAFAGVVDTWDAINEVVIMPIFTAEENNVTKLAYLKGRVAMIKLAFEEARAANPRATLLLNDFDLSAAYECLIEACLAAGITIDVLGLQTHMHQGYWGEDEMLATVERFARYGIPIHMTESSLVSGHLMPPEIVDLNDYQVDDWPSTAAGEERQADEMVRHYRSLVSHPAVKSIVYWGLSDRTSWLGAPTGLIRRDGTKKPSYSALESLIKSDWWVGPTRGETDGEGCFGLDGWLGEYNVSIGQVTQRIHLDTPGNVVVDIVV